MNSLISIIIAITVIGSIIRSIVQAAEKLKKDNTSGDASAGHTRAARANSGAPPTSARAMQTPISSAAPQPAARSRAEELAMRRKAQLEELRRRRAGKGSSPAPRGMATRAGSAAPPAAPRVAPGPVAPASRIAIAPMTREASSVPDRSAQRQRQKKLEALRARQEAAAREQAIAKSRERVDVTPLPMPSIGDDVDHYARKRDKKSRSGSTRIGTLRSRMSNKENLRELFLLKELLDPPVAMRDPDSTARTG